MNSSSQSENGNSAVEELTAYLDGELDEAGIKQVEQRLDSDPKFLAEMQALQKTWDLLDHVPQVEPGTSFTQSTMEIVVGVAAKEYRTKRKRSWAWPLRVAVLLAVPIVLFATSFAVVRNIQQAPDRELVRDLSLIENHPRYLAVETNMQFLTELSHRGLFSDAPKYGAFGNDMIQSMLTSDVYWIPDSDEGRKQYVESLDVQQKNELKKKRDDFVNFSDSEKKRLIDFEKQLSTHENRSQLINTMNAYYDWLKTLERDKQAELLDLASPERLVKISKLREEEALKGFGIQELPGDDADYVFQWCQASFALNEREIRAHFPEAVRQFAADNNLRQPSRPMLLRSAKHGSLSALVGYLIQVDREFIADLILQDDKVKLLYNMLQPEAKHILDERPPSEQRDLIMNWVESANQSQYDVSHEDLRRFANTLSVKRRDELRKLSTEGYFDALRDEYRRDRRRDRDSNEDESWQQFLDLYNPQEN